MSTNKGKCHVCDRVFHKAEHLIRHKRSHTGERPYICSICGRCFARRDVLSRHQKIHPRNQSYHIITNVAEDGADFIASTDKPQVRQEVLAHTSTSDGAKFFDQVMTKPSVPSQCPSTERTQGIDVQTLWHNSVKSQSQQQHVNVYAETDHSIPQMEDLMNQAFGESTASTCSSSHLYQTSPDGEVSISTVITPDFTDTSYLDFGTPDHPLIGTSPHTVTDFLSTNNKSLHSGNELVDERADISESIRWTYGQNGSTHINALSEDACFGFGLEHNMEWLFGTDLLDYESSSNPIPWSSGAPPGRNGTYEKLQSISNSEIWPSEVSDIMPESFTQGAENFRIDSRMARLEQCWSIRGIIAPKIMPGLWANLISDDSPNIFSDSSIKLRNTVLRAKPFFSRWGFDETCRDRLENHYGSSAFKFPSAKDLNMALDLFFRHYHSLVPFIHLPTFSASSSPTSTLLIMCLIGLHVLNTTDFNSFIHEMLPIVLDEVRSEVEFAACGTDSAITMMRKFGTAFLALSLASMTEENGQEQSMLDLYIRVISLAQRNGCFDTDASFEVDLLHQNPDSDAKWKAWANVESAKRILVTLLMADSWFAGYHHTLPAIRTDRFQMLLPCNEQLFRAPSPAKWSSIQQERHPIPTRRVQLGSNTRSLPNIHGWHDTFEITTLLNSINICILEEYNLPLNKTSTCNSQQKPRKRDRSTDLVLEALHLYGNSILGSLNYNCAVLWNHMCIQLTTDLRIFEAAACRTGINESREALKSIKSWSRTPQARRACLHAVQILRITSERYVSDGIMFPTITALFSSALVLGLYLLTVPDTPQDENFENVKDMEFDMLGFVNWEYIQGEGLPCAGPNQLPMSDDPDDPALGFIKNGGQVCIGGSIYMPGYQSARQVFLEFACLSEEIAKWNVGNFFQILRAMSDAFVEVDL